MTGPAATPSQRNRALGAGCSAKREFGGQLQFGARSRRGPERNTPAAHDEAGIARMKAWRGTVDGTTSAIARRHYATTPYHTKENQP